MHADHALMNKLDVNARIIRWLLLLQQFDLTIVDKPGKENVVADFLSRVNLLQVKKEWWMIKCQMNTYFPSQYSLHGLLI